jgi:hypothetical protein
VLAAILYLPWLPVLLDQTRAVRGGYWIPPPTWADAGRVFFGWALGVPNAGPREVQIGLALLALVVAAALVRGGPMARFFLLQALVPWALALGISLGTGTSIFVERYLVFGHVFWLAFWGWLWLRLAGAAERAALTCIMAAFAVLGLSDAVARWPAGRPAIERGAEFLSTRLGPGDVVVVASAVDVNRLRCYLTHAGAPDADVRTRHDPFARNLHMSHAAALAPSDLLAADFPANRAIKRIWVPDGGAAPPADGMEKVLEQTFEAPGGAAFALTLWARKQ